MAKKIKTVAIVGGKVRKTRRDTIDAAKFVAMYQPMATEGKSAKEIGEALGRDATYVCVKATMLRKAIQEQATKANLSAEDTTKALAMVPKLKAGRPACNVLKMLGF